MQETPETINSEHTPPAGELSAPRSAAVQSAPPPGGAEPARETAPSLEELLKKAELAAAEHHDAWLRARAEADNIRKRSQSEIAAAHKFAVESFAAELLAVKDSLEAALAAENASVESMTSGVELTLKQLAGVFERFNLAEINPAGQKFDPHRHQAISTVDSDAEPNTVVQVLQKGYLLHDRVIRPALVTVAKARSA
ncbi:MAG: nucleotide exchange factor GrpE [Betaproteobacteria bacterium]|nr:nucleotide exchange factor GrpE [Betaproteobacteria bacterium]